MALTDRFPKTPDKAIDGIVAGYPTDSSKEWASNGETVGAWLLLTWPRSYSIDSLVFFDRPNTADWITGGTVTWSDGTTLTIPKYAVRAPCSPPSQLMMCLQA